MKFGLPATVVLVFVSSISFIGQVTGQELQGFRVVTEVFKEKQKEAVSDTLTLFTDELVYDFLLNDPEEVTILDVRRNRIVLLDKKRSFQFELKTSDLLQFTAEMKAIATDPKVAKKEWFEPRFTEKFDEQKGELVLQGKMLTYRTQGLKPKLPNAVRRYREFADWYARLNAMRGGPPPFPRIELNRALAEKGLLPQEVSRTMFTFQPLRKKNTARSQHDFIFRLSNSDRKRIENTGQYQAKFKKVTMAEYWGI